MMVAIIICLLLCVAIGTFTNYIGIEVIMCAFEFAGGKAIGCFFGGMLLIILSLIMFNLFALCGKLLIEQIKYILKGGE